METRSARKKQLAIGSARELPSTPNGFHSSSTTNGVVNETQEMKQAALVKAIESTGALLLYLLSSSLIIILNKRLMVDDGFKFPLALTGMSQVAGALAGAHHPHHPVAHAPMEICLHACDGLPWHLCKTCAPFCNLHHTSACMSSHRRGP
jgi:hypothetical protein